MDGGSRWVTSGYLSGTSPSPRPPVCRWRPARTRGQSAWSPTRSSTARCATPSRRSPATAAGTPTASTPRAGRSTSTSGDKALGDQIASFLQSHASELNLYDVIWWDQIWTPVRASEGWRSYGDHRVGHRQPHGPRASPPTDARQVSAAARRCLVRGSPGRSRRRRGRGCRARRRPPGPARVGRDGDAPAVTQACRSVRTSGQRRSCTGRPPGQPSPGGTSTATAAVSGEVRSRGSQIAAAATRCTSGFGSSAQRDDRRNAAGSRSPYRCSAFATASRTRQRTSGGVLITEAVAGRPGRPRAQCDDLEGRYFRRHWRSSSSTGRAARESATTAQFRCCRWPGQPRCSSR